ncbi:xanthine dehydrogenase accessory factor [Neobacillus sp. B4I6]|uniref:XdhC family protein n=1 Tax=Neobacillus sp. B4I6 TaxID=3373925 RepID=UPI003D2137ED
MLTIINEMERCAREKKRGILATVIRVEGSAYQKEGAKCFIAEDGELIGLLSGGCVENDIIEHGKEVLQTEKPKKIYYDFRDEGDQIWGLGVGCNGAIEIFLELYDPKSHPEKCLLMKEAFTTSKSKIIATVTEAGDESKIGEKWIFSVEKECISFEQVGEETNQLSRLKKRKSKLVTVDVNTKVFFDYVDPVPSLFIFGAGPDAVPLVKTVKNLGWKVKVIDHRPGFVNEKNFPLADELICYQKGESPDVPINENAYAVVMSHHFIQDQIVLESLLKSAIPYIGVLGPVTRTKQLLQPIVNRYSIDELKLDRIYSPIGIDIGAKHPEEIALSIASELVNVHRDGNSLHLKHTKGESILADDQIKSVLAY